MAPKTQYAKKGEVSIAYQVIGDGPIDLVFAATFPERVSGLIGYGASARMLPEPGYVAGVPAEVWDEQLDLMERGWGDPDQPAGIEVITPSRVDDDAWRSTLARMQRLTFSPSAARAYMRMVLPSVKRMRRQLPAKRYPQFVGGLCE